MDLECIPGQGRNKYRAARICNDLGRGVSFKLMLVVTSSVNSCRKCRCLDRWNWKTVMLNPNTKESGLYRYTLLIKAVFVQLFIGILSPVYYSSGIICDCLRLACT